MSYFNRKAVRESLSGDMDVGAVSVDDVSTDLLEIENDTLAIGSMDIEASVMDEDMTETEERMEALSDVSDGDITEGEMEQIDVAQESIRGRWGFRHRSVARESLGSTKSRRKVAREGLWDDIKSFFKRMLDWFKEKLAQLKDRWLKFHNLGKSMQKKSKKFDALINKLGQKDKDTISGSWIEYLCVNGEFSKNIATFKMSELVSTTKLKDKVETTSASAFETLETGLKKHKAEKPVGESSYSTGHIPNPALADALKVAQVEQKAATAEVVDAVAESASAGSGEQKPKVDPEKDGDVPSNVIGNHMIVFTITDGAIGASLEKIEGVEAPSEVPTPTIAELKSVNSAYSRAGVDIEKYLQAWRKRESAQEIFNSKLDRLNKQIDKHEESGGELASVARLLRGVITNVRNMQTIVNKQEAHTIKCISKGLDGYLTAGIRAYKKAKS